MVYSRPSISKGGPKAYAVATTRLSGVGRWEWAGVVVHTSYIQDLKTKGGSRDGQEFSPSLPELPGQKLAGQVWGIYKE